MNRQQRTTGPSDDQKMLLQAISEAAEASDQARRKLHRLIREGATQGLRAPWMAKSTGLARSTIYLILDRRES